MAISPQPCPGTLTTSVNDGPALIAAFDPEARPAAADYAQRHYPRSTLARLA